MNEKVAGKLLLHVNDQNFHCLFLICSCNHLYCFWPFDFLLSGLSAPGSRRMLHNLYNTWVSLLVKWTIHPCFSTLDPFLLVCFTDTTILCSGMLLLIVGVNCCDSQSGDEGLVGSKSSWLLRLADSASVSFSPYSCSSGISFVRSISEKFSDMALESVEPSEPTTGRSR